MMHHALDERHALSETLRRAGAQAPTLCGDWTTTQLVAHLVLRERSMVEAAGRLPVAGLKRRAEQVVHDLAASEGYDRLVDRFDQGPSWREVDGPVPTAWLWAIPFVREQANVLEYLVHHEDVRRAGTDWAPRPLPVAFQETAWKRLHLLARVTLKAVPVGLVLAWPSNGTIRTARARKGGPVVTVTGDPVELAMFAFGRLGATTVEYGGAPADIETVRAADIGL